MKSIDIVTYMHSRSASEHTPMYVNGHMERQTGADYFHSFITNLCCNIDIRLGSKVVSIDHHSEWGVKYVLSSDKADVELNFMIASQECPYLDDDIMQKTCPHRNWFVHHVDVDKVSVRDWIDAETTLTDILSNIL